MKDRPILFNAEMVRAILDGRKTQTRRLMKPQPEIIPPESEHGNPGYWIPFNAARTMVRNEDMYIACPYGLKWERLWVRETFGTQVRRDALGGTGEFRVYRASNPDAVNYTTACGKTVPVKWKPSLHMPRWASRITLEITSVRIECLDDISEEDALAEGFVSDAKVNESGDDYTGLYASDRFFETWQKIYGQKSLLENPWVWVITFKRVEAQR